MTAIEHLQGALNGLGLKGHQSPPGELSEEATKKKSRYAAFPDELLSCEAERDSAVICGVGCN